MAATGFLDLPPELRNHIYHEYFSLHRGQMHIKTESASWTRHIPRIVDEVSSRIRTSLIARGIDIRASPRPSTVVVHSTGPITILMASKFVFNEAVAMFAYSTTFHFTEPSSMFHFMKNHDPALLQNITSIIIDQSKGFNARDLKFMIGMAGFGNRLPSLSSLCIYVKSDPNTYPNEELRKIRQTLLEPGLFHGIRPGAVSIVDPLLKTRPADNSDHLTPIEALGATLKILRLTFYELELYLLTPEVRDQILSDM